MSSIHLLRVLSPVQLALTPSPLAVRVSTFGVAGEGAEVGMELILDGVEAVDFLGAVRDVRGSHNRKRRQNTRLA